MLDGLARERVLGVGAEGGLAAVEVAHVVDSQGRVVVEGIAAGADVLRALLGARGGLDGNGGAVHVILLGAGELGGPGPGVRVCAGGDIGGDGHVVGTSAGAVLGGATTLNRQDDAPSGGLRGLHVGGQSDLARTTTVDGGTLEAHGNALASGDLVADAAGGVKGAGIAADLAGEVGARRRERAVCDGIGRVRGRVREDHMGGGGRSPKGQHSGQVVGEGRHFGDVGKRQKLGIEEANLVQERLKKGRQERMKHQACKNQS